MTYNKLLEEIRGKQKGEIFSKLSEYTYINYLDTLDELVRIFPTPTNEIKNWKEYKGESRSNIGLDIETVIVNYLKENNISASIIVNGRGRDIKVKDLEFEVKSSSTKHVNSKLQSTFYKNNPKKFYIFVTNTKKENITLRIVSSQILYRLSLGEQVYQEIANNISHTLDQQIAEGLSNLDFTSTIKASLLGEQFNESKTFSVGDKINVRFQIYFEPK